MYKKLFIFGVIFSSLFISGCVFSSDDDFQLEEFEKMNKQLQEQVHFLENENDRLQTVLKKYQSGEDDILQEDLVSKTSSNSTTSSVDVDVTDRLVCGGSSNFLCPNGYVCEGGDGANVGVCVENKLNYISTDQGQEIKQKEENSSFDISDLIPPNSSSLDVYNNSIHSFEIGYPKYWYYKGFGSVSGSLFTTGFSKGPLDEDSSTIDASILLSVMSGESGQAKKLSGNKVILEFKLNEEKYIKLTAPSDFQDVLEEMKNSLLVD